MHAIEIANKPFEVKEYKGKRVVTFKDIDMVHSRPEGTAGRNFRTNKKHFIEGEDFYRICPDEIRRNKIMAISPKTQQDVILVTESGYLMLVKSFTDDLAWDVQRQLVKNYFRAQDAVKRRRKKPEQLELSTYEYFFKRYLRKPVLSDDDLAYMLNAPDYEIRFFTWEDEKKNGMKNGVDFYYFTPASKWNFYRENKNFPKIPDGDTMYMFSVSGVLKVCRGFGAKLYHLHTQNELNARMLRDMGFEFDLFDMLAHVAGISAKELIHICDALRQIEENHHIEFRNDGDVLPCRPIDAKN